MHNFKTKKNSSPPIPNLQHSTVNRTSKGVEKLNCPVHICTSYYLKHTHVSLLCMFRMCTFLTFVQTLNIVKSSKVLQKYGEPGDSYRVIFSSGFRKVSTLTSLWD